MTKPELLAEVYTSLSVILFLAVDEDQEIGIEERQEIVEHVKRARDYAKDLSELGDELIQ